MKSAAAPALVVLATYTAWVAISLANGHGWRDFALIGHRFAGRSTASAAIDRDRPYASSRDGYDGQFFLYIARDPRHASPYVDYPNYRYSRIGYPIAARVLALGRQSAIPVALVAINVAAVAAGTFAVALWLFRRRASCWLALVYGLHPGMFIAVLRDLSEALAYALAALAVVVFDEERPRRLAAAAALFALALLTRELTVVFLLAWAATLFMHSRRRAIVFAAGALAPYLAWRAFVTAWFGGGSAGGEASATLVPFGGLLAQHDAGPELFQLLVVVFPAAYLTALAVWALVRRRVRDPALWAILGNFVLFVALLPKEAYGEYIASTRVTFGVVLATLLAYPALRPLLATRRWLVAAVALWSLPWLLLLPLALDRSWS